MFDSQKKVITGQVIKGRRRGVKLGFPTVNLTPQSFLQPGIYISETNTGNRKYESVTFIGPNVTFGEKPVLVETHLLDFDGNLYDQKITVSLIRKIRGVIKFKNEQDLVRQIASDIRRARQYFAKQF